MAWNTFRRWLFGTIGRIRPFDTSQITSQSFIFTALGTNESVMPADNTSWQVVCSLASSAMSTSSSDIVDGDTAATLAAGGLAAGGDETPAFAAGGLAAGGDETAGGLLRASATTFSTPGT